MTTQTEALKLAHEELKHIKTWCLRSIGIGLVNENVLAKVEEALAQPEQEPDGYVQTVIEALYENGDPVSVEAAELLERMAQRKPLTDEQREKIAANVAGGGVNWTLGNVIDAVEAAHGIKE